MLERVHGPEEERAVADGNDDVFRQAAELLENLVDISLGALVEEGVVDMICIVHALLLDLGAADIGAVVARSGNDSADCAVRADHIDLLRAGALRDEDLAADARAGAVGGDGVACITARILHDLFHADGFAVRDQDGRAAVLEGERRHKIIHFQKHVAVQTDDGRHALTHGNAAPALIVQRHEAPVAELAPFVRIDRIKGKDRRRIVQLPESAAFAVRLAGRHGLCAAAFCADITHFVSSSVVKSAENGKNLDRNYIQENPPPVKYARNRTRTGKKRGGV